MFDRLAIGIFNNVAASGETKFHDIASTIVKDMFPSIDIIERTDIDVLLEDLKDTKNDLALIFFSGCFIDTLNELTSDINTMINIYPEFLISGIFRDDRQFGGHYFSVHPNVCLVNLRKYRQLRNIETTVEFGNPDIHENVEAGKLTPSEKNLFSNYTPMELTPAHTTTIIRNKYWGWNFINLSAKHNLPLISFSRATYRAKKLLDPTGEKRHHIRNKIEEFHPFNYSLLDYGERRTIKALTSIPEIFTQQVRPIDHILYDTIPMTVEDTITIVTPANGLFLEYYLFRTGNTNCRVIEYANNLGPLQFKRDLRAEWSGLITDLYPFVNSWCNSHDGFKIYPDCNRNIFDQLIQNEVSYWGNSLAIKETWDGLKNIQTQQVMCDLITNPEDIIKLIPNGTNCYVAWDHDFSNITNLFFNHQAAYVRWQELLFHEVPNALIHGIDHTGEIIVGRGNEIYR